MKSTWNHKTLTMKTKATAKIFMILNDLDGGCSINKKRFGRNSRRFSNKPELTAAEAINHILVSRSWKNIFTPKYFQIPAMKTIVMLTSCAESTGPKINALQASSNTNWNIKKKRWNENVLKQKIPEKCTESNRIFYFKWNEFSEKTFLDSLFWFKKFRIKMMNNKSKVMYTGLK